MNPLATLPASPENQRLIATALLKAEQQASNLRHAALEVARVWDRQCGRVFESMGNENPRAKAIEDAIDKLKIELA